MLLLTKRMTVLYTSLTNGLKIDLGLNQPKMQATGGSLGSARKAISAKTIVGTSAMGREPPVVPVRDLSSSATCYPVATGRDRPKAVKVHLIIARENMEKPQYVSPNEQASFNELHSCCWQCGPSGVRWCLRNGFDPNAQDERGWTALIWLVRMHDKHTRTRKKMFRWLIQAGADIEYRTKGGDGLLELAKGCCSKGFYRFVRSEYQRLSR